MTIIQFNPQHDANINAYEELLAVAIAKVEQAQHEFDANWRCIFTEFDRAQGSIGAPARFICEDGYVLSREVSNLDAPAQLDPVKLRELIFRYYSATEAAKVWTAISEPVKERRFSQDKLEKAIRGGKLPVDLATQALVPAKQVTSRHRRPATKEDMALLAGQEAEAAQA